MRMITLTVGAFDMVFPCATPPVILYLDSRR